MNSSLQLAPRTFPSRIAELGFTANLPAGWIAHELPAEQPDFSNPTQFFPLAIVTAPLTEELLFRGFLYGVVKRITDRWFAAVFTAMIFALVHLHVGSAPPLFLLGLCLAIAYEQTGCLLVPSFMHAMFNAWNVAMLVYETFTP